MKKPLLLTLLAAFTLNISMAFANTEGEEFSTAHYPKFSWDRLPVCLHFSKMAPKGGSSAFTPKEIAFIAKHPVICIEKTQGGGYKSLKEGTEAVGKAVKAINPDMKILYYLNSGKDFNGIIKKKYPSWHRMSLKDKQAGKKFDGTMGTYDHANKACTEWWANHALDACSSKWVDGVFIDGLVPVFNQNSGEKSYGKEGYAALSNGLIGSLLKIKNTLNAQGKMIIGNSLRGSANLPENGNYLHNFLDGGMIEHFDFRANTTKEVMANDIRLIQDAARLRKICVVKAWPHLKFVDGGEIKKMSKKQIDEMLRNDITYPLACFLVAMGEYSYFCYSWGYREDAGGLIDYPEYNKPIGEPKGLAVKEGWTYTREFEHVSVWIDIENKKAKIDWKK